MDSPHLSLDRRAGLALCFLCLLAYGYFVYRGPHHNPDSRLALTYALVERGTLAIDADAAGTLDRAYVRGHYYTDKAPGLSFLLAPLYAGLRAIVPAGILDGAALSPAPAPPSGASGGATWPSATAGADRFVARYLLTYFGIGVPAALFSAALFTWLRRLEPRPGPRLAAVAGYALGSPAYPFTVSAFGHVPAGMCLFGAFALLAGGPRSGAAGGRPPLRLMAAGLLLGLATAIEYPAGLAALAIAAYGVWQTRGRPGAGAALAAGAAPVLVALGGYHWAVFGLPWSVGYAHLDPGTAYAAGQSAGLLGLGWPSAGTAVALLGGLRRGLLVHAPWLSLAVPGALLLYRRRDGRPLALVALAVLAVLLALNSAYVFWDGGASWGPRHLVPALPFLTCLALPAMARWPRLAWVLSGASVAITATAVATRTLPAPEVAVPLRDVLLPAVLGGAVTNNWGQLAGLAAWRGVVPLLAAGLVTAAWVSGLRRAAGWLTAGLLALLALATLHRAYLEYSEGYYLYLGMRLAGGARLYAEVASTQPPLLPWLIALLWRISPDVYLPRVLAVSLYLLAALLAGRLAHRLSGDQRAGAVAMLLAAVLPLGSGTAQVLDANAVLAPLGVALPLLFPAPPGPLGPRSARRGGEALRRGAGLRQTERRSSAMWGVTMGVVAALGLATKLTFLGLALAPVAALLPGVLRGRKGGTAGACLAGYAAGLATAGGLQLLAWWWGSGPAVLDGLLGELESPLLPAGAVLAALQLLQLELVPLGMAAWGWWLVRRRGGNGVALWGGVAAAGMPLFAAHQGTFVGVARPAEPFVAALAGVAVVAGAESLRGRLAWARGRWRGLVFPLLVVLVALQPVWQSLRGLAGASVVDPQVVLRRLEAAGDDAVLAPPYYAALARKRLLFDYADWTVWGMRAAAGVEREVALSERAVERLQAGALPLVAVDFRIRYLPAVQRVLVQRYVVAGDDGDIPARGVTFFVPAP